MSTLHATHCPSCVLLCTSRWPAEQVGCCKHCSGRYVKVCAIWYVRAGHGAHADGDDAVLRKNPAWHSTTVGAAVGVLDGAAVGGAVGTCEGADDGTAVGTDVGDTLGTVVGAADGVVDGAAVGSAEGAALGRAVGVTVGAAVGLTVQCASQ